MPEPHRYLVGEVVTVTATYRDADGEDAEPDVSTARVEGPGPDGAAYDVDVVEVDGEPSKRRAAWDSTGYEPGIYTFQVRSTGDAIGVAETRFRLVARRID